jgi:hypothetical protein
MVIYDGIEGELTPEKASENNILKNVKNSYDNSS